MTTGQGETILYQLVGAEAAQELDRLPGKQWWSPPALFLGAKGHGRTGMGRLR